MDGANRSGTTGSQPFTVRTNTEPPANASRGIGREESSPDLTGQSTLNEVDFHLRQQNFPLAKSKAESIRHPENREKAFGYLIRYCMEMKDFLKARSMLNEIKDPRGYNILTAQICSGFIQQNDKTNAIALASLFKDDHLKAEFQKGSNVNLALTKALW